VVVWAWPRRWGRRQHSWYDEWSLRIRPGEMVAVAGPSGFGGTTLTRVVTGLVRPSEGSVLVNGTDVSDQPAAQRRVGLIPAGGGLLPQLTLEQNVTYGARIAGQAEAVVRRRLDELADNLGLLPSLRLLPHETSPGQRFRAAFARAAMRSPGVLVVDATVGAEGVTGLRALMDRAGIAPTAAMLVCTHRAEVVDQADTAVLRLGGRTGPHAPLAELRSRPDSMLIARLTLPGPIVELTATRNGDRLDIAGLPIPLPDGLADMLPDGDRVPVLSSDGLALGPPGGGIPATVVAVDRAGPTDTVVVTTGPAAPTGNRPGWRVRATGAPVARIGDRVGITLRPKPTSLIGQTDRADEHWARAQQILQRFGELATLTAPRPSPAATDGLTH
jgi:ABC-type sugar transport system ATPase subunit